jgi:hypothetical protein
MQNVDRRDIELLGSSHDECTRLPTLLSRVGNFMEEEWLVRHDRVWPTIQRKLNGRAAQINNGIHSVTIPAAETA